MPAPTDFDTVFRELTPFLLSHGWLFPPKILGGELNALWDRCERFRTNPPQDAKTRREAESEISHILVFNAFHPNYRAYYVWLAMQQPYASSFSHLIENGVIHYCQRDYLSCVHSLLPAVEGILRAHFRAHNPSHQGQLSYATLRAFLRSGTRPIRTYPKWHEMYRQALSDFLERWLWIRTDKADRDLSCLNRHYALHGLGHEHYYRSEDCHRLFMFLDLYLEMLVLETRVGENAFIPDHEGIRSRRNYYQRLMRWSERSLPVSTRAALLREHPHFHDEAPRESDLDRLLRWATIMGLDRLPSFPKRHQASAPLGRAGRLAYAVGVRIAGFLAEIERARRGRGRPAKR